MNNLISRLINGTIAILFVVGLGILLYPSISQYVNKRNSSSAVATYQEQVLYTNSTENSALRTQARTYNTALKNGQREQSTVLYYDCLNLFNGIMGYIEIDKINVKLPIYHGTADSTLQQGVGHLEWSTLPTGDLGNHTILTGHTGLPSAKLFTDLDQLRVGDSFVLNILDMQYLYAVEQISVVEPHDVDNLSRDPENDLVTLVTCTPYGVNSHRLLVQGSLQSATSLTLYGTTDSGTIGYSKPLLLTILEIAMVGAVGLVIFVVVRQLRNQ